MAREKRRELIEQPEKKEQADRKEREKDRIAREADEERYRYQYRRTMKGLVEHRRRIPESEILSQITFSLSDGHNNLGKDQLRRIIIFRH